MSWQWRIKEYKVIMESALWKTSNYIHIKFKRLTFSRLHAVKSKPLSYLEAIKNLF